MKFNCFILVVLLCLLNPNFSYSQTKEIELLKQALLTANADTNKVNILNALSQIFISSMNYVIAGDYSEEALALAEKLGYKQGMGYANLNLGYAYSNLFRHAESIKYLYASLKIFEDLGNKQEVASSLLLMSSFFFYYGKDTTAAFNSLFKVLEIRKENPDKLGVVQTYNMIGGFYLEQGKHDDANQQHFEALKICLDPKFDQHSWGLPYTYACIGNVYRELGDKEFSSGNKKKAFIQYDSALKKYFSSLVLWKKIDRIDGVAENYLNIGNIYVKLKNTVTGKVYLSKALQLGLMLENKNMLKDIYSCLSVLDSNESNFKQAYEYYKLYVLYRDSMVTEEVKIKTEGYKMQYEFDKKENKIKLLSAENQLKSAIAGKESEKKNFAYATIVVVVIASGYGFYRYRRRRTLQSQQAMLNERLRISRELHDEVGATLSGIAMYSHLTKEQMKTGQTGEIEKSLNIMQESSTQMVDKLSDIVWLINPEQDSLQKLVERLEEYATDMAAIKNMQVKINVPEKIAEINLPVESRRNIYLFCKEAINNAVKYSNATLLELIVKEINDKLEFSVSDNGKGFDAVMVRRGNGLENMQKRADEIGATLLLQSKENGGASVSLQCKIS